MIAAALTLLPLFVAPDPAVEAAACLHHVRVLASDAFEGRSARHAGGRRAAAYIAWRFEAAGADGWRGTYAHPVGPGLSPNVAAVVPGTAGGRAVVIGAHYDHLPMRSGAAEGEDRIFNGADDNASGVAALIELAEALAARPAEADVVLVAFSAEEIGLVGSEAFAAAIGDEATAMVNFDMISRGPGNTLFAETNGHEPFVELLAAANGAAGLELRVDERPQWRRASDHASFLDVGVPAVYFGVENHADYHRVSDEADRVDAELIASTARLVEALVRGM